MIANYHTHTPRCHHAVGAEEEYIDCAIEAGLQILGFSDHTPYPFPDGYRSHIRMDVEEYPEYARKICEMKEKYDGKIQLHLGVEAEYYPKIFPELLEILRAQGTEYLLLGQHFLYNEAEGGIYAGAVTSEEWILRQYCDQAIEGIYTGMFSCMAHPDLVNYVGDKNVYRSYMRKLCKAAKECDVPLEVNLLGLLGERHYPNEIFWEIAAEENCCAIMGVDAHLPKALLDREIVESGEEWIARFGLKKLETLAFHSIE